MHNRYYGDCALLEDICMFCIWDGYHDLYPEWFLSKVLDDIIEDEYRNYIWIREGLDDIDVQYNTSIFLLNKAGQVIHIDIFDFYRNFVTFTGGRCVLYDDHMNYFIWTGMDTTCPNWFMQHKYYAYIQRDLGIYTFYNEKGETHLEPSCVFIRNIDGEVYFCTERQFFKTYVTG